MICIIFIQCNSSDAYTIQKNQVGLVYATTQVSELDKIFANDSLVKPIYLENQSKYRNEDYVVYSKAGNHLLTIKVENTTDSTSTIQSVQVFSTIYKSKKEISLNSFFKELNENHEVDKIEPTITSASVFVKDLNASFFITNKELNLPEFNMNKIEMDQVPDNAAFKYITVWFN